MGMREGEFGGVDGMVPKEQRNALSLQQEMWVLYATNPAGNLVGDGSDTEEVAVDRVGYPAVTYTPGR